MHLNTRKFMGAAAVCFSATSLIGGMDGQQARPLADASSWIRIGTAGCSLQEQIEVDKNRIVNINSADRDAAIQLLKNDSAVLLSRERFKEFVSGHEPSDFLLSTELSHVEPYLVRAVSANTINRSIAISRCHRDIFVFRGSLGGDGPQYDPVVVFLESKPRRVFVRYMTAK